MTETIISQGQAAEMGFLLRVQGVALCDKVCSCKIFRVMNVAQLLRIEGTQEYWFSHLSRMPHKRLTRQFLLAKPTENRFRGHPRPRWSEYISNLAWSRCGVELAEPSEIVVDR